MSYINSSEIDKILVNAEFNGSIHIMENGDTLYHKNVGWTLIP